MFVKTGTNQEKLISPTFIAKYRGIKQATIARGIFLDISCIKVISVLCHLNPKLTANKKPFFGSLGKLMSNFERVYIHVWNLKMSSENGCLLVAFQEKNQVLSSLLSRNVYKYKYIYIYKYTCVRSHEKICGTQSRKS